MGSAFISLSLSLYMWTQYFFYFCGPNTVYVYFIFSAFETAAICRLLDIGPFTKHTRQAAQS